MNKMSKFIPHILSNVKKIQTTHIKSNNLCVMSNKHFLQRLLEQNLVKKDYKLHKIYMYHINPNQIKYFDTSFNTKYNGIMVINFSDRLNMLVQFNDKYGTLHLESNEYIDLTNQNESIKLLCTIKNQKENLFAILTFL